MEPQHNFDADNKIGKQGEDIFKSLYANQKFNPETKVGWIDVSENAAYQKYDVDFIWFIPGRTEPLKIEIKYDQLMYKTGNIFAEHSIQYDDGYTAPGFLYKSTTDCLYYIDSVSRIVYGLDFVKFREFALTESVRFREGKCRGRNGYRAYTSLGWLINKSLIPNECLSFTKQY